MCHLIPNLFRWIFQFSDSEYLKVMQSNIRKSSGTGIFKKLKIPITSQFLCEPPRSPGIFFVFFMESLGRDLQINTIQVWHFKYFVLIQPYAIQWNPCSDKHFTEIHEVAEFLTTTRCPSFLVIIVLSLAISHLITNSGDFRILRFAHFKMHINRAAASRQRSTAMCLSSGRSHWRLLHGWRMRSPNLHHQGSRSAQFVTPAFIA